jgi:KEOPS complex subunit Pcc1
VSRPHETDFSIEYRTESRAAAVADAVGQEVGAIDDERSATTIDREDRAVEIHVDAADLVALRAAANTWLGLVRVAEETAALAADERRTS